MPAPSRSPRRARGSARWVAVALVATAVASVPAGCGGETLAQGAGGPARRMTARSVPVTATPRTTRSTSSTTTSTNTTTTTPTTTSTTTTTTAAPPIPVAAPATPPPAGAGNRLVVVGDSIMLGTKPALPAALPGWDVTVDAVESRNISALPGALVSTGAAGARVVVVHLCTNYWPGGGFARALENAMVTLARVPRVVWVTCVEWSTGPPEANAAIRAAAVRYGSVAIADWAGVARTPGYSWTDGIHPQPAGQRALARLVGAAVGPP